MAIAPSSMPMTRCDRFSTEAKCLSGFSLTMQRTEPPLIKLARHATGVIGVIGGAVGARRARRGEVSQRRDTLGPVALACLPQVRADKRLRAMLEGLFDRNHDHRRGARPLTRYVSFAPGTRKISATRGSSTTLLILSIRLLRRRSGISKAPSVLIGKRRF